MSLVILAGGFALLGGIWIVAPQLGCKHRGEEWMWRDESTIPQWRLLLQQLLGTICLLVSIGLVWAPQHTLRLGSLLFLLALLLIGALGVIMGPVLVIETPHLEQYLETYVYQYMRWRPPTNVLRGIGVAWFVSGLAGLVIGQDIIPQAVALVQTLL